jgi:uroporphyrinogen-III synthase
MIDGSGVSADTRVERLAGFRIGVTADRRSADLIAALERRGAEVLHAPALRIAPHDQDGPVIAQTRAVIEKSPEVVLVTTGYGVRRWFEVADAAGLGAELTRALERAVIMARGPKAVGAVRAAGLDDHRGAREYESTAAMVDGLVAAGLVDRRVAIQVHGYTDEAQVARLREVSAQVLTVTPYRWVSPRSPERLNRLIQAACDRRLDAVAFTSAPGVEATLDAAERLGRRDDLVVALATHVLSIAVGPMTAAPLRAVGLDPAVPDRYRLGAMIRLICERLDVDRAQRFRFAEHRLEIRGHAVMVDDRPIVLAPHALDLLRTLVRHDRVICRAELMTCLSEEPEDHALDVAMSRLRRSLGVPGLITTVVKRGYRFRGVSEP